MELRFSKGRIAELSKGSIRFSRGFLPAQLNGDVFYDHGIAPDKIWGLHFVEHDNFRGLDKSCVHLYCIYEYKGWLHEDMDLLFVPRTMPVELREVVFGSRRPLAEMVDGWNAALQHEWTIHQLEQIIEVLPLQHSQLP